MNKNFIYGNQGQPVPEYICTGISRVFVEDENLFIIFQSPTGIETSNEIYLNETVRVIIPKSKLKEFGDEIIKAIDYGIQFNKVEKKEVNIINDSSIPEKDSVEIIGNSIGIF